MRLIFICLLIANIAIAVWGFFLRDGADASSAGPASISTIVTKVDESQELPGSGDSVSQGDVEDPNRAKRLCEIIGPFDDDQMAADFVERLRSIDIVASVDNLELPAGESYWLHLEPEDSVALAFKRLAEVQSQGIESYVVGRGELKNAISLGVFTYKNLAEERAGVLRSAGLEPIVRKVQRTQVEIWVTIQPEDALKISDLTWTRLLEGMSSQERRQNFCLPVAS
jgi:hypothetical protein